MSGVNLCYYGLNNHFNTREMKQMYEDKNWEKETYTCFYSNFFQVAENKRFYKFEKKNFIALYI